MRVEARYAGDGSYRVTGSVSGTSVTVDTRPDPPEAPRGPRPMELLLVGAATCPAVDLLAILEKGRHPARDLVVEAEGERAADHPRRFTDIHLHFRIIGEDIPEPLAERAVRLAVENYCSVVSSLNARVTHSFAVEAPEAGAAARPARTDGGKS